MLIEEAKWFGQKISEMNPSIIFPMCNVGSSTEDYRTKEQPWIDEYIFRPIKTKKQTVKHLDIQNAPGVDIAGDLSERCFLKTLGSMKFQSVFCSNLLEHVSNKDELCRALVSIIPVGGYIFISCPFKFPIHFDPIDTMFRPNMKELSEFFPGTSIYYGEVVIGGTYWDYITDKPLGLLKKIIRLLLPLYKPAHWFSAVMHMPWIFKNFQVTCLILRKDSEEIN